MKWIASRPGQIGRNSLVILLLLAPIIYIVWAMFLRSDTEPSSRPSAPTATPISPIRSPYTAADTGKATQSPRTITDATRTQAGPSTTPQGAPRPAPTSPTSLPTHRSISVVMVTIAAPTHAGRVLAYTPTPAIQLDNGPNWKLLVDPGEQGGPVINHSNKPPCPWYKSGGVVGFTTPMEGLAMCGPDWGASYGDYLYKSEDGGKHWEMTNSQPGDNSPSVEDVGVTGLFFLDKEHGWYSAVVQLSTGCECVDLPNQIGLLRATTDGGKTWKSVATSDKELYDLQFVSPTHGVAHYGGVSSFADTGGSVTLSVAARYGQQSQGRPGSAIVETKDGGATWTALSGRRSSPAHPVFFDAMNGVTVGGAGEIGSVLTTSDGGQNWTRTGSVEAACGADLVAAVDSVSFADSDRGWVLAKCLGRDGEGLRPIFARTTDAGRSWMNLSTNVAAEVGKDQERLLTISFIDQKTGYASTARYFLVTHDAGNSFTVTGSPVPWFACCGLSTPMYSHRMLSFSNHSQGWGVEPGQLFLTVDSGSTWRQVPVSNGINPVMAASPDGYAWVLAGDPHSGQQNAMSLLVTADAGSSWMRYQFGEIVPVEISLADARHGWIVDDQDQFYRTTDAGKTWMLLNGL